MRRPWLGIIGAVFIFVVGMTYLEWLRRKAIAANEGYGTNLVNEPEPFEHEKLAHPLIAILPLVMVGVMNKVFTEMIPGRLWRVDVLHSCGDRQGGARWSSRSKAIAAIWAVEGALLIGIADGLRLCREDGDREICRR